MGFHKGGKSGRTGQEELAKQTPQVRVRSEKENIWQRKNQKTQESPRSSSGPEYRLARGPD